MARKSERRDGAPALADRINKIATAATSVGTSVSIGSPVGRSGRKQVFRSATLTFITGEKLDVAIKNLSASGARVEFMRDVRLPDRVYLSEPTLPVSFWAYVIWQNRGSAGLEFA